MKRGFWSAAVGACAMAFASTLPATTATVNYTDLWWNSPAGSESGWGVNMTQQGTKLFMTFYVYGQDTKPTWIFALLDKTGQTANGQPIFTGYTAVATGPWYGGPFSATPFKPDTTAGSITFVPKDAVSGTLTYDVFGTHVTKSIERETLVNDDLSGNYFGVMTETITCPGQPAVADDIGFEGAIEHSGTQFQFQWHDVGVQNPSSCTFSGGWTQQGSLARVDGTVACSGPQAIAGSATLTEVSSSPIAVSARIGASAGGCTITGTLSALRR
jgi:hypothetical protein